MHQSVTIQKTEPLCIERLFFFFFIKSCGDPHSLLAISFHLSVGKKLVENTLILGFCRFFNPDISLDELLN